jgi:hypothetical protein
VSAAQIPAGFILTLETRHFSFEAHGLTEAQAVDAMKRLLREHGRQCGLPADWSDDFQDDIKTHKFAPGTGSRDGAEVVS